MIVLAWLLNEVNATILTSLYVDAPIRRFHLRQKTKAGEIHFDLAELSLYERHFNLNRGCRFPAGLVGKPPPFRIQIEWDGIWQINDGQGNCYPILRRWLEGGVQWGRFQYTLHLRAFPAIAPSAQLLTIRLSAGALVVQSYDGGTWHSMRELWRGDLVWVTPPLASEDTTPISGGEGAL